MRHTERHKNHRIGWLRAAVLGANDGIISTASLILGIAAGGAEPKTMLMTGVAGLVAGSMAMAAGEYVSVSSQADTEQADIAKERLELATQPEHEHTELAAIYAARGLDAATANSVATQLMAHDALGAHSRDELGISDSTAAQPVQAAVASAVTFAVGAALPLMVVLMSSKTLLIKALVVSSLVFLAALGALAARAGGSSIMTAAMRVTFWGALAMAITYGVGSLFGVAV
jgi:VIT1/CCC1 family predicted Fe2+/Mn2+ transporter